MVELTADIPKYCFKTFEYCAYIQPAVMNATCIARLQAVRLENSITTLLDKLRIRSLHPVQENLNPLPIQYA